MYKILQINQSIDGGRTMGEEYGRAAEFNMDELLEYRPVLD